MNHTLFVNDLVNWKGFEPKGKTERILWMDEGRNIVFVIDVNADNAMPEIRKLTDLELALETELAEKLGHDPFMKAIPEDVIMEKYKMFRNSILGMLSPAISLKNEPAIYFRENRGTIVKEIARQMNISSVTVYKHLRRYWQRGKNINALLPDFLNCGGKGKFRVWGEKKTGRPRNYPEINGEGINITSQVKKVFEMSVSRFYHTNRENTFSAAYELMLKEFFTITHQNSTGELVPVLLPLNSIPTIRQFRYWYEKERNIKKMIQSRKGAKKFELNHRAILGKSDYGITGPGSKYQIDATVGDVYLVSRFNRSWIIGRPVIYFVIDIFSRMIAGMYVGLEGPSWVGAMMALANAMTDKVKFCREYDMEITDDDWSCHHVPEAILADRGELEGRNIETLINSLNVRVENNPPYRADWKAIVEQYFKTVKMKVKPFLPGFVITDSKERGGRDYRLDAKIDIYQFTKIIIKCVLVHNNEHRLDAYGLDEDMIADNLNPIPKEIWDWGIGNRSGRLRTFPEDIIKLNLMPSEKATVTAKGIKFRNMYYCCHKALKDSWFENARNKGSWKVDIAFDPRNMSKIYLRGEGGQSYEECSLLSWQERFMNKSMDEINYLLLVEKMEKQKMTGSLLQARTSLNAEIETIVEEACKMNSMTLHPESETARVRGIRSNRKAERSRMRKAEVFNLGSDSNKIITVSNVSEDEPEYPCTLDLIAKKLEERLNGCKEK